MRRPQSRRGPLAESRPLAYYMRVTYNGRPAHVVGLAAEMMRLRLLDLDLDVYQGPFDLLFTLILKEEVDVFEIPLAEVILAYVRELAGGAEVDWDGLSEFLVLISSLLELKSRILLPGAAAVQEDVTPELARDLLVERLLRYRQFKGAAAALGEQLAAQRGRRLRAPSRDARRLVTPEDEMTAAYDPARLRHALGRLLSARRELDTSHVALIRVDMTRQIAAIRRRLAEHGRLSFDEVFGGEDPMVQAVTLLALLELLSRGDIRVSQRRPFADIEVAPVQARKIA